MMTFEVSSIEKWRDLLISATRALFDAPERQQIDYLALFYHLRQSCQRGKMRLTSWFLTAACVAGDRPLLACNGFQKRIFSYMSGRSVVEK